MYAKRLSAALNRFGQKRQRLFYSLQANGFSVSREMIFRDGDTVFGSNGNVNETDAVAAGACKSRNGNGVIHAERTARSDRHGACGFGRNGTLLGERLRGNAEKLFLNTVVIRDNTAEKYGGRTRDIRNGGRNKTSGTAFRRTEGYVFLKTFRNCFFRER